MKPVPIEIAISSNSVTENLQLIHDLHHRQQSNPELFHALMLVKRIQCHRFRHTYHEALQRPDWGPAANFFLSELYSDRDFSKRDAQFARIAPSIQRLFPANVVTVTSTLIRLHAISEQLDHEMACSFLENLPLPLTQASAFEAYVATWRRVGNPNSREQQLDWVQFLGDGLTKFVRTPGLRMMLRMMRKPAAAAWLEDLQFFLELGIDTFAQLDSKGSYATDFLAHVHKQEQAWMSRLFDANVTSHYSSAVWPELE